MDIGHYITELLNDHDVVSVPGFGIFYREGPLVFKNTDREQFLPGFLSVGFKAETSDDDTLTNYIIRTRKISENSARYFATNFGSDITRKIEQQGFAELGNLGRFIKSGDETKFLPGYSNTDDENFGLEPVSEFEQYRAEIIPEPERTETIILPSSLSQQNIPVSPLSHQPLIPDIAEAVTEDETEIDIETERKGVSVWVIILSIVVFLGIAAALVQYFFPEISSYYNELNKPKPAKKISPAAVPANAADSMSFADSVVSQLKKNDIPYEKAKDTARITVTTKTLPPAEPVVVFEIIGASLANQDEADQYIKQLRSKGLNAHIVKNMAGKRIKVSLATFNDEASALKELPVIRKIQPDAYIQSLNKIQ